MAGATAAGGLPHRQAGDTAEEVTVEPTGMAAVRLHPRRCRTEVAWGLAGVTEPRPRLPNQAGGTGEGVTAWRRPLHPLR